MVLLYKRSAMLGRIRPFVRYSAFRAGTYRTLFTSPYRMQVSLIYNLFASCNSCGIKLQNENPLKPGFYRPPSAGPKLVKPEDESFNRLMNGLLMEDRKLLLNSSDATATLPQTVTAPTAAATTTNIKKEGDIQCIRCREAMYKSNFSWDELPVESIDKIISTIPPDGNIVYIVNAVDFPFSLNRLIFKYRNPSQITFLVTKCDLLFPSAQLGNRYGATFFKDYLSRTHGADPEKVFVTSGMIDWNMKDIIKALPDNSYMVGGVNSGKSTVIKSLLYTMEKSKPNYLSSKQQTKLEKQQDRMINSNVANRHQHTKSQRKVEQKFKMTYGPGTSYMPGFTRGHIVHEIDGKTIVDVPGFSANETHGIYGYLDPSTIKTLSKGVKVHKRGMYDSRYESVRNGQVLTIGGLFYLATPQNAVYQIKNCINHKFHVFTSMDKAISILQSIEKNKALENVFLVNKQSLDKLQKFIIPPFYGSIDLVIKNLGHLNITPTGKKIDNEPLVIYLPEGVEAIIRQPLTRYITRSLAGRDKNGNPLRKELWKSKSVTHLQRFNGTTPFASLLIPSTGSDNLQCISEYHSKLNDTPITYDNNTHLDESNKYKYWVNI